MEKKILRHKAKYASLNEMKSLRVKLWSRIVMYEAGFKKKYRAAQKFFTPSSGEDSNKQWQRYYFGKPIKPNQYTITKVTKYLPGTEKWFYLPLWEMFVNNIDSEEEILDFAYQIKDPIILNKILYEYDLDFGYKVKTKNLGHTINYLVERGDADSLSALSILLLSFELNSSTKYKNKLLKGITKILLVKSFVYPIGNCFPMLYQTFVNRFCYKWSSQEPEWGLCDDSWIFDKQKLFKMVFSFDSLVSSNWKNVDLDNQHIHLIEDWLRTIDISTKLSIILAIFLELINGCDETESVVNECFKKLDANGSETRQSQNQLVDLFVDIVMPVK